MASSRAIEQFYEIVPRWDKCMLKRSDMAWANEREPAHSAVPWLGEELHEGETWAVG
jgi:hypothetical protein